MPRRRFSASLRRAFCRMAEISRLRPRARLRASRRRRAADTPTAELPAAAGPRRPPREALDLADGKRLRAPRDRVPKDREDDLLVLGERDERAVAHPRNRLAGALCGPYPGLVAPIVAPFPARTVRVDGLPASRETLALQGFPGSGRSRTRTWDLFLIREAPEYGQSSPVVKGAGKPRLFTLVSRLGTTGTTT